MFPSASWMTDPKRPRPRGNGSALAYPSCNDASLLMKREHIWSREQATRRILDGMILLMDIPWDLGSKECRKKMEANGFRWDWDSLKPYSWWQDALAKNITLLTIDPKIPWKTSNAKLHYFHPLCFLRSLLFISDSIHWINEDSLSNEEIKYAGKGEKVNDAGNGIHKITHKAGEKNIPVESEW